MARRKARRRSSPRRRRANTHRARTRTGRYAHRRRANSGHRRRSRRSNTRVIVVASRRRRSNPRRRVSRRRSNRAGYRRRRNPTLFGSSVTTRTMLTMVGGGLIGVAAAKFLPTLVPANLIPGGGSFIVRTVITGAAAFAAGWLGRKFVSGEFGDAVLFGGLMQTGSVALNAMLPGFRIGGQSLALSGMGELMPGQFTVPQNPLRLPPPPPTQARMTMNGLTRAYGVAF